MSRFRSIVLILFAAFFCLLQIPQSFGYDEEKYNGKSFISKADSVATKMRNLPDSIIKSKPIIGKLGKFKGELDSPITFKKGMFKAAEFEKPKMEPPAIKKVSAAPARGTPAKRNETEAEKAERVHRTFEKLLTFVEIVGQVDNYVSTKWKNLVRTVSNLYDEENEDEFRVKKLRTCPLLNNSN